MNSKTIIIVLLALALGGAGVFYYMEQQKEVVSITIGDKEVLSIEEK